MQDLGDLLEDPPDLVKDHRDLELGSVFDVAGPAYRSLERPLGGPRLTGQEVAPRPPRVRLTARLVRRDDDVWVFEVSVEAQDLDWQFPDRIELTARIAKSPTMSRSTLDWTAIESATRPRIRSCGA